MKQLGAILGIVIVLLVWTSLYTVSETELAIKFRLGEIIQTDIEPGLHVKMPLVNNVRKFEGRIMTLDAEPERYLTSEKKDVIVDSFVKWRISDATRFYTATRGDEFVARQRLGQIIKDGLRSEFAKRTLREVVTDQRGEIMSILRETADRNTDELGISVVDVRIKRIDLPEEVSESVYARMRAERSRVANELRAEGREEAEQIRAEAERRRTVILAEAYREAEGIRGEGDAKATEIYAKAFSDDPEFYSFSRSLKAYRETFQDPSDLFVLDPSSDFFDYFNEGAGEFKSQAGSGG